MPEISRFFGIVIYFYKGDHAPPHFHASYAEQDGLIEIESGKMIKGDLSKRAQKLIREWVQLHKAELVSNYEESQKPNPVFQPIKPLS